MKKSCVCHEADPDHWGGIRVAGLRLLKDSELELYRELMPKDEDRQGEWKAAIEDPGKYVTLLVGQVDEEEQREERDEENHYDCSEWEQTTQSYFLSYHEVRAHLQWAASRPAEAEAYKRFQVGECLCLFPYFKNLSLIHLMSGFGIVSRRRRAEPRVIRWGLAGMGASSR